LALLDVGHNGMGAAGLDALTASPHLTRLRLLRVGPFHDSAPAAARQRLVERYGEDVCAF
jgi:hypothetical protein